MHRKLGVAVAVAALAAAVVGAAALSARTNASSKAAYPTGPVNLTMWWWGEQEAAGAKAPLEDFIRQSIEDPDAYVAPGYSANVMPPFKDQLTPNELDVLVKFLATNAK